MRMSDWSSDVCSSDLLRDQRSGDDRGLGKGLDHEAAAKFLHDDEGLLDAFGETARLGRDRGGQEAEFCHLAPDIARPSGLRRADFAPARDVVPRPAKLRDAVAETAMVFLILAQCSSPLSPSKARGPASL